MRWYPTARNDYKLHNPNVLKSAYTDLTHSLEHTVPQLTLLTVAHWSSDHLWTVNLCCPITHSLNVKQAWRLLETGFYSGDIQRVSEALHWLAVVQSYTAHCDGLKLPIPYHSLSKHSKPSHWIYSASHWLLPHSHPPSGGRRGQVDEGREWEHKNRVLGHNTLSSHSAEYSVDSRQHYQVLVMKHSHYVMLICILTVSHHSPLLTKALFLFLLWKNNYIPFKKNIRK